MKFILTVALLLMPSFVSAQFYVATSGSDSNAGTLVSPFATLGKCQTAMRGSSTKTCIIRGGTYGSLPKVTIAGGFPTQAALFLTSADSGTTWQYYASDGYNTAILDGGNTTTGSTSMCQNTAYLDYGMYIEGASNITVNGLTFQNFTFGGVALHGGSDYFGNWFPTGGLGSGTADRNLIENNIMQGIHNGIPTTSGVCTSPAWPPDVSHDNDSGGGIAAMGKVTNLTVTHNAVRNTQGEGMDFQMFSITDNMSGLSITNNFVDNANTANNDSGCMHIYNYAGGSSQGTMTGVIVNNNYLHDCGGSNSSSPYGSARGLYADDGASNITATGNVVSGHMAVCFNYHGGHNNLYYGNICDLGDGALGIQKIVQYQDSAFCTGSGCMAGNAWRNNIVISKASTSMGGYNTFISGSTPLNAQNDLTHAYGTGAVTDGASVSTADPQLSGWTYTITSGSPAFNSPVSFPKQPAGWGASGFWGPPGYVLPQTGTPPSCGLGGSPLSATGDPGPTAWPGHVATSADLLVASDHVTTTLSASATSGATTISVASASGVVVNQVVLINDPTALEEVKVTAISGTTLTVTRGYAGTAAASHASGVPVLGGVGATYHNQLGAELGAFEGDRFGHIGSTNGATASAGSGVSAWPFHPATASDLYAASDFASTTLTTTMDAGSLTLAVVNGSPFVASQLITVEKEQMKVCAVGSTSLTICASGRGMAGTTTAVHVAHAPVRGLISATTFRRLAAEISALESDLFFDFASGGTAVDLAWPNHAATTTELLASCTSKVMAACYNHMANEVMALEASVHAGPVVHSSSVIPYTLPSRLGTSSTYSVSVSGTSVPVKNWKSKHWSWFAFSGTVSVTITVAGGFSSFTLSPKRIAPSTTTSGNTISFTLSGGSPIKLVLNKINGGGEPLFIIADPIEVGAPASSGAGIFNIVTSYGADPSNSAQSTDAIQNAIDAANAAGGGTVYVPAGTYKIGPTASRGVSTIFLKSNVTLYLAPGAILQVPSGTGCCFHNTTVFSLEDVSNITIKGRGIIDGTDNATGASLLKTENATNFSMTDTMWLDCPYTAIRLVANGVTFQNVKVLTNPAGLADGIDMESCQHITIDHSLIMSTDDNYAIGAGTDERTTVLPMGDFKLTNNLMWNFIMGHSLSIVPHLSNSSSKLDTLLFDGNDTIETDEWVAIYPFGGTNVSNITISNSSAENVRSRPFAIEAVDCTDWGPGNCGGPAGVLGYVHGVNLQNITWNGYGTQNSRLFAFSSTADIEHVHIQHLVIGGTTITSSSAMHLDFQNQNFVIDLTFAP